MNARIHRTRVAHRMLTGSLVAGACLAVAVPPAFSGDTQPVSSGMVIYIDPQTGAILKAPAPGTVPLQLTPALQNALSTSDQGLAESPSSVPGGGVKVDLQGRFQSPLFATTDANGKVKLHHLHETQEPGEKK